MSATEAIDEIWGVAVGNPAREDLADEYWERREQLRADYGGRWIAMADVDGEPAVVEDTEYHGTFRGAREKLSEQADRSRDDLFVTYVQKRS